MGLILALALLLAAPAARGQDAAGPAAQPDAAPSAGEGLPSEPLVEIHAFVSQGFILTTANNWLAETEHGSFEMAEAGINFTRALTDRLRAGLQLFARDLGPIGNYSANLDWFYLDYRASDGFGVRAGRVKLPFGLYNDTSDIDAARVPVLLPQAIYPTENRNFLLAQTGVEAYGQLQLGGAGALAYNLYGGTVFVEIVPNPNVPYTISDLRTPILAGGRLLWEAPVEGLRLGGSLQFLRLEATLRYPDLAAPVDLEVPALLWIASVEYQRRDWLLAAEYSRWRVEIDSSDPARFPEATTTSERAYAMASVRVGRVTPGLYYSLLFPDADQREGREHVQHDVAATVRLDLNTWWLFKLEAHLMHGTAGLTTRLNAKPLSELAETWGAFLLKTTAYF